MAQRDKKLTLAQLRKKRADYARKYRAGEVGGRKNKKKKELQMRSHKKGETSLAHPTVNYKQI